MSDTRYLIMIILCVILIVAVCVAAYFTSGFRSLPIADADNNTIAPGGSTNPGGSTTPGGNTDPGGSITPGGSTTPGEEVQDPANALTVTAIVEQLEACRVDVTNGGKFAVAITVNPAADFEYTIDGLPALFSATNADWLAVFDVHIWDGYFTIDTRLRELGALLESIYQDSILTDLPNRSCYFLLTVTAENGATNTQALTFVRLLEDFEIDNYQIWV